MISSVAIAAPKWSTGTLEVQIHSSRVVSDPEAIGQLRFARQRELRDTYR
jgi:hypothetical protein